MQLNKIKKKSSLSCPCFVVIAKAQRICPTLYSCFRDKIITSYLTYFSSSLTVNASPNRPSVLN